MIVVYGKNNCPYCVKAKEFLDIKNIPFEYIDLSQNESALHEVKTKYYKARSVPVVIVDDVWIGGYEELKEFVTNNYVDEKRILNG